MIVVDTSVWIDYFNGRETPETVRLDELLGRELLAVGDIILLELLQGFRTENDARTARRLLSVFPVFDMLGSARVTTCARHYRMLRRRGITIRKTVDVIIAYFCLAEDHALLFSNRDFEPFVAAFGLRNAMTSQV